MSGYAAPKIDKVRIGFIGQGMRGPGAVQRMSFIDGWRSLRPLRPSPERAAKSNATVVKAGRPAAKEYSGENGWKEMIDKEKAGPGVHHHALALAHAHGPLCHGTRLPRRLRSAHCAYAGRLLEN